LFSASDKSSLVAEPESSRPELLAEDAVLLLQGNDDVALLLVDPAGQRDHQEPKRMPEDARA